MTGMFRRIRKQREVFGEQLVWSALELHATHALWIDLYDRFWNNTPKARSLKNMNRFLINHMINKDSSFLPDSEFIQTWMRNEMWNFASSTDSANQHWTRNIPTLIYLPVTFWIYRLMDWRTSPFPVNFTQLKNGRVFRFQMFPFYTTSVSNFKILCPF